MTRLQCTKSLSKSECEILHNNGRINRCSEHIVDWEAWLALACMGALNEPVSSDWDDPPGYAPCKFGTSCSPNQQVAVLLAQ